MTNPITDEERLAIVMQLKYDQLQKQVARAQRSLDQGVTGMERRTKKAADSMEKSMGSAAGNIRSKLEGIFAPFIAGGAITAAVAAFKQVASTVAEVGREADKARVNTKTWQQWTYVAKATGASVDGVTDALKELNIRGDEFATTGKGSAQEAFERLGYTAADVAERLRDPSRFLDEIIIKLQKMDKAAQARNLDELFGGTGAEEMSKMLGLSVGEIQKLRSEAALFTDEQIAAAKKVDAEFETLWRNVMVYSKQAALESLSYMDKLVTAISWLKGDHYIANIREAAIQDYNNRQNSPATKVKQLNELYKRRYEIIEKIADLEKKSSSGTGSIFNNLDRVNINRLKHDLDAVDKSINDLAPDAKLLTTFIQDTAASFANSATAALNFKDALNDLKNFVPELKSELDELAKLESIDKAFEQAVKNAQTPADIEEATRIRDRARTVTKYGDHKDLFALVRHVESGNNYNATLDNGRWTGGAQNLTNMTLDQIIALQGRMLTPENRALYGNGQGSSALGAYQITRRTLKSAMKALGLAGDTMFDNTTQDALANYLANRRGNNVEGLRNEWEGLRRVDADTIKSLYAKTDLAPVKVAPSASQQQAVDDLKRQDEARKSLNQSVSEGLQLAQFEQSISGMSESQKRVELEVYRRLQEAKRAGLSLSDTEVQSIRQQITATEQLRLAQQNAAKELEGMKNAQMFFAQSFTSALSGLLTGTTSLTNAVRNLASSLMDAVLQAALLGQGPLAALFGGGTGLLGSLFGFSEGGYTGRGNKYEPAGVVHRGEFVMSAAATRRLGVQNLQQLHEAAKTGRGYAEGGFVGDAPSLPSPDLKAVNNNTPKQEISISAPVTVNASAGTPEQNQDLAKRVAKQMEDTMRGVVTDELRRQTRAGNFLNSRSR